MLLSQDLGSSSIPILEAAALQVELQAQLKAGLLTLALVGKPCINTYSSEKLGWEPLMEPWCLSVHLSAELTRFGPAAAKALAIPAHGMS